MPAEPTPDLTLRPATPDDAEAVAEVHLASRAAAPMPPGVHSDEEVRAWLATRLDPTSGDETWVAQAGDAVVGYLRMTDVWLDDLYVAPDRARRGVGGALLGLARALRPAGLSLWVFESNAPARRFYARHGFTEVRRTDGSDNEERSPDLELRWQP